MKTVQLPNQSTLSLRIGIHCGPAYAAVVGVKQPVYAFFGNTVNISGYDRKTAFNFFNDSACVLLFISTNVS